MPCHYSLCYSFIFHGVFHAIISFCYHLSFMNSFDINDNHTQHSPPLELMETPKHYPPWQQWQMITCYALACNHFLRRISNLSPFWQLSLLKWETWMLKFIDSPYQYSSPFHPFLPFVTKFIIISFTFDIFHPTFSFLPYLISLLRMHHITCYSFESLMS